MYNNTIIQWSITETFSYTLIYKCQDIQLQNSFNFLSNIFVADVLESNVLITDIFVFSDWDFCIFWLRDCKLFCCKRGLFKEKNVDSINVGYFTNKKYAENYKLVPFQ